VALCACGVASASEGNIVQAKRAQTATEAVRGSNPPPPRSSAPGARPAFKRSYPAPHAHAGCAKQRRLQDDRVRCRRFTAEPNEGGSANSSRRLSPLSALLTPRLSGRPEARPVRRERILSSCARGAPPQAHHGPLQAVVRGTAAVPRRRPGHLALTHRAHARNSHFERSQAFNEAIGAECSRGGSGATHAFGADSATLIPECRGRH